MKYQKLFEPVKIGKLEIRNRFAMCGMGPVGLGDHDGGFNQRGIDYYVERAKGGTGLIITGVTFANNKYEIREYPFVPCATIFPDHFIRTANEMNERIHSYGSASMLMISAGFGRVYSEQPHHMAPVSASMVMNRWKDVMCRPLTVEEIRDIVKSMGQAALVAKQSNFDGVQIHAVHEGYLLDQFATAFTNTRTDEYGGSLDNRLRFAKEVVEEIKRVCGADFPVTVRYSPKHFCKGWRQGAMPGEDFVEFGRDIDEGLEVAKMLEKFGYDALDIDVGCYDAWYWNHPPMYQEKGLYRPYAKMLKEVVNIPIICAGRMDNPDMAQAAIEDGTTDMIGLARPLLADPDYVKKLRKGDLAGIRPCLSCHEGCLGRMVHYKNISCAVNPSCSRERYARLIPTTDPKKIAVVGGGPGGMEAARCAALRGHDVTLFEATDKLGGKLVVGGVPDFKEDDLALIAWYEEQMRRAKVNVVLNTFVTSEMLEEGAYDEVVIATGANAIKLNLGDPAVLAEDVLLGKVELADELAIIGGGLVGCETALWAVNLGKKVTIITEDPALLAQNGPASFANSMMIKQLLPFKGVEIITSAHVKSHVDGKLTYTKDGQDVTMDIPQAIQCVGFRPDTALYEASKYGTADIHRIGDCKQVHNIMQAIWEGFEVGCNL